MVAVAAGVNNRGCWDGHCSPEGLLVGEGKEENASGLENPIRKRLVRRNIFLKKIVFIKIAICLHLASPPPQMNEVI